jgi:hypothetical protein
MGKKLYPTDTLDQALDILSAINRINPLLTMGTMTSASLSADVDKVKELQVKVIKLQLELSEVRNQRDEAFIEIWDKVKRTRAYVNAFYGDDSFEYSLVGGTRLSEKKPIHRKASTE